MENQMQKLAQIIPQNVTKTETEKLKATINITEIETKTFTILSELRLRYPSKTANWASDRQLASSWARVIFERRIEIDEFTLKRALAKWQSDFPPDIGDLLNTQTPKISDFDVQKAVQNIASAAAKNELCGLSRNELYAYQNYPGGSFNLRNDSSAKITKNVEELLLESLKAAVLPELVPANQMKLSVKSDPAKVINLSCFLKSIKK